MLCIATGRCFDNGSGYSIFPGLGIPLWWSCPVCSCWGMALLTLGCGFTWAQCTPLAAAAQSRWAPPFPSPLQLRLEGFLPKALSLQCATILISLTGFSLIHILKSFQLPWNWSTFCLDVRFFSRFFAFGLFSLRLPCVALCPPWLAVRISFQFKLGNLIRI